jgi:hypothetical protein
LAGDGVLGFILILTVVDFGGVVGLKAPPLESARTNWTLSSITAAVVMTPETAGLRYTEVLLEILLVATVCAALGPDFALSLCCNRGLAGKAPKGAGGPLDGFSTAGMAVVASTVFAYA